MYVDLVALIIFGGALFLAIVTIFYYRSALKSSEELSELFKDTLDAALTENKQLKRQNVGSRRGK